MRFVWPERTFTLSKIYKITMAASNEASKSGSKNEKPKDKFLPAAWRELKKVHTPTRHEAVQATLVVILMVVFFATCLGVFDFALGWAMQMLLS